MPDEDPRLDRLAPDGPARTAAERLAELRPWELAPAGRPFVYVNMVASADGRATLGESTHELGGPADLPMLLELRTLADAVLIGSGTLRAEGYARLVGRAERRERRERVGLAPDPVAVLLSRGLDLPWDAGLFADPDQPVLVYTGAEGGPPAAVAAEVEVIRLEDPTPAAALADLRCRGVCALLCEGGPTLNRSLLEAGLVDELFLTLAAVLTGDDDAPAIVEGGALGAPARLALRWVLHHEGELYLRYGVVHAD